MGFEDPTNKYHKIPDNINEGIERPLTGEKLKEDQKPKEDLAGKIEGLRKSINNREVFNDKEIVQSSDEPISPKKQKSFIVEKIFRPLIKLWEVEDNLPEDRVDATVGMSLAQSSSGEIGKALEAVTQEIYTLAKSDKTGVIISSNRFITNPNNDYRLQENSGTVLAELVKDKGINEGVKENTIITPNRDKNLDIRNTFMEAEFAIKICKERGLKSLQIVANHIHMKRVLETFNTVIEKENYPVKLYWKSVGQDGYGINASAQHRFIHPLFFLGYEAFIAYPASRLLGWSKAIKE